MRNASPIPVKKLRIAIICIAAVFSLFFFWNNALILDDFHSTSWEDATEQEVHLMQESQQMEEDIETAGDDSASQSAPQKGYHIHINLDEHQMYVYKNGSLLKTYPVSGGKPSTPTPLGTWRIISKDTWGEGFGGAWMGFNVPWGKYGIHGTVYPWQIGKQNGSKGCIRMLNKHVRELYKIVPHGTTVTIVHESRTFRTMKSGDIGSDVKELQVALKKLGYYRGHPDGKYGSALANSVKKFQKEHKLWTSGTVNRKTYNAIMDKVAAVKSSEDIE